jgi:hypothetical protein
LSYYALSLAQDSMYSENLDDIKFKRWSFTALKKLKEVFEWLKLQQPKSIVPENPQQ